MRFWLGVDTSNAGSRYPHFLWITLCTERLGV